MGNVVDIEDLVGYGQKNKYILQFTPIPFYGT